MRSLEAAGNLILLSVKARGDEPEGADENREVIIWYRTGAFEIIPAERMSARNYERWAELPPESGGNVRELLETIIYAANLKAHDWLASKDQGEVNDALVTLAAINQLEELTDE
jgi:hypothetical protein